MIGATVTATSGGETIKDDRVWSEGSVIRGNTALVESLTSHMLTKAREQNCEVPVSVSVDGGPPRTFTVGPNTTAADIEAQLGDLGVNVVGMIINAIERQMGPTTGTDGPARTAPLDVQVHL